MITEYTFFGELFLYSHKLQKTQKDKMKQASMFPTQI